MDISQPADVHQQRDPPCHLQGRRRPPARRLRRVQRRALLGSVGLVFDLDGATRWVKRLS